MIAPRPVKSLGEKDKKISNIWTFVSTELFVGEVDETFVLPENQLPVSNLISKVALVDVTLSNGKKNLSLISNVFVDNIFKTQILLTISIFIDGSWFDMARAIDPDFDLKGPGMLSEMLGLKSEEIFPIKYDLSPYVLGKFEAISGYIESMKPNSLTDEELLNLILSD